MLGDRLLILPSFAALAILNGVLWLASGVAAFGEPTYWSPSSPLDYAAVGLFSAGALAFGLCLWFLSDGWRGATSIAARIGAISAIVVSGANIAEDALLIRPFGALWIAGVFALEIALLVLGVALALTPGRRALALPVLLTLVAFFLWGTPYGRFVLAFVWLAAGALSAARVRPFSPPAAAH